MSGFNSIDGLISGLNTTEIIDAIIEYERTPAVLMEVEQAEKTNIVTTLKALQAKIYAVQAKAQQLSYAATYQKSSIQVSDETVLTATAGSGTVSPGTYDVQVRSVARNHQLASQGLSGEDLEAFGTGTIRIAVGSASAQTITIDASNNSLTGIKDAINDAKVGVTATILDDGSNSNQYRLILTAKQTGKANTISIASDLTGGADLNFDTASFDAPETLSMNSGSDAQVSLGSTAAYTGSENKIYTFTVQGDGEQTVGSDNITIDWTDGTNSGSIIVTQADFEYELVGDGADGLKLAFSSGTLNAGDSFQIQSFAPLLQEASDAEIAFGSGSGGGSPIVVTNSSNKFYNVIPGITLDVQQVTDPGETISVTTDIDVSGIKDVINEFISAYNDVNDFIDEQNSYDQDTEESGILLGDSIIQSAQYSIQGLVSTRINNESENYSYLASLGIRSGADGKLAIKDSSTLEEALRENLDDVITLFTDTGYASIDGIEFVSATTDSRDGLDFDVNITQAATRGNYTGTSIADPGSSALVLDSSNNRLHLTVDGVASNEIILAEKSYDSVNELLRELQDRIDNDLKIGGLGATVAWEDNGDGTGYLIITSSSYGSNSKISIDTGAAQNAATDLGLFAGTGAEGLDVEGTINGEEATGIGQILSGDSDNETTAGLKLKITLTEEQLVSGAEGTLTLSKGLGSKMNELFTSLTASGDGVIDRRIKTYENQVENLSEQIEAFDERLELRRERLLAEYQAMEQALSELSTTQSALEAQIASLNGNWKWNTNSD